jgi:phosphohistidine phosphatase
MKTLYLLRHAKSSWDDPDLKDFDRPLNKRGLKAAPRVGALLQKQKLQPDIVLSSPALRAKQTTHIVCEAAGLSSLINFDERIYEAGVQRLFEIVIGFSDTINVAVMVGHNPGFEELVSALTGESQRMPTAALACIELKIKKWSDLTGGSGKLKWLVRAKDLS